ncbi:MAG TPA: circadian clock KaiB family protein [Acidimicrobiales bacterium]|nr:circadian clock KaiB family protein [Acidimicrobiales bacterium]
MQFESEVGRPAAAAHLRLYVTGRTARSRAAIANVRLLAERYLGGADIETVDVLERPEDANEDAVVATPMLVRRTPGQGRRVIGDLAAVDDVADWLELEVGAE